MGLKSEVRLALELYKKKFFKDINKILDLGSQDILLTYDQFKFYLHQSGLEFDSKDFDHLKSFPNKKGFSSKYLWNLLGIKNYQCSDINSMNNSKFLDLNKNNTIHEKYDLVTDFGNNEHVFNIIKAYENMHELCNENGYLWISQAVTRGNGFFTFDQSFFEGMAMANNYKILYSAYIVGYKTFKDKVQNIENAIHFHVPCNKNMLDSLNFNNINYLGITYVFQKTNSKSFNYFYQYNYDKDQEKKFYDLNFVIDPFDISRMYIPSSKSINSTSTKELLSILIKRILKKIKIN